MPESPPLSQEVSIAARQERQAAGEMPAHAIAQAMRCPVAVDRRFAVEQDADLPMGRGGCAPIQRNDGVAQLLGLMRPVCAALRGWIEAAEKAAQHVELTSLEAQGRVGHLEVQAHAAGRDVDT